MAVRIRYGKEEHYVSVKLSPETKEQLKELSNHYKISQTAILQRAGIWYGKTMQHMQEEKGLKY